ncbi:457_t:CDS:2, partial [Dentiscutata heterogama]
MPPQPQKLDDINIPNSLCSTLSGENFLVKDSIIEEEQILLFTTKANIQHLSNSLYWMIDGIFKTVLTIFRQLYTFYAPVGTGDNSRVLSLVYVLMTKKLEFLYRALFQDLIEFAEENNILLSPTAILTDFELAKINASRIEFLNVNNKSFLLSNEIPAAFDVLKEEMSTKTKEVVKWFEENYVHKKQIRQMLGRPHVGVYTIIEEFQKEQQKVEHQVEAIIYDAQ